MIGPAGFRPGRLAAAGTGLLAVGLVGALVWGGFEDRRLLIADPDRLPADRALSAYALPRGRAGFERHCAGCHEAGGRGDPTRGVPRLTDHDWLYGAGKVSEIETTVLYGVRAPHPRTWRLAVMPAYARPVPYPAEPQLAPLSPGDIDDVVAYLLSVEGRASDPQAARRGGEIFHGRGGCYDCHGGDARGDSGVGAPNLADDVWLYGKGRPEEIRDSIAHGRAGSCPAWSGRLSRTLIREIALYVHTLSAPRAPAAGGDGRD